MNGVFIYSLLFIQLGLTIFTIITTARFRDKRLAALCAFCFLVSIASLVIAAKFDIELLYPYFYASLFLIGNLLLLISSVLLFISGNVKVFVKTLATISGLGGIAVGWFFVILYLEFSNETLFKERIHGDFYLTYYTTNDGQIQVASVAIETPFYVKRNIRPELDGWEIPEEIEFISFQDSILAFSVIIAGKEKIVSVDTRFDSIEPQLNGIKVVWRSSMRGAIDSTGKIVIPIGMYEDLMGNYDGLMYARRNGKVGYVDTHGNVIIPFQYDGGGNFLSDSTTVKIKGRSYWINKKGVVLCRAPYYDDDTVKVQ